MKQLDYPFDTDLILRKQKSLKRSLLEMSCKRINKKIAILGGSTTAGVIDALELFLLNAGINPIFYESDYNKYFEEGVFENRALDEFAPDIVIVYTSIVNLLYVPEVSDSKEDVDKKVEAEYGRYVSLWESIFRKYNCIIIQNNFDMPIVRPMGNGELTDYRGLVRYINRINALFASYGDAHEGFYVHDINYLSVKFGLDSWHRRAQYYAYKTAFSTRIVPCISYSLSLIIKSVFGLTKKCLVLDLDNTLWGGVIGDDGVDGIILGNDSPIGEAYTEFQNYLLGLKKRGVLLAICSKNNEDIAKKGFERPDSVLKHEDFVAFKANWENKDINIRNIANELDIGLDSMVFIDDNPVERELIRQSLPMISVPEVDPKDVFSYIRVIEGNGYFEQAFISQDDLKRNESYAGKKKFKESIAEYGTYEDFLRSLSMKAEIKPFYPVYYDRIAQLTNKSNQYNLTTKRCTVADIAAYAKDENGITLYARLQDKYGDYGLVSAVVGTIENSVLHIILWLMSCRVLKRDLEIAIFDEIVRRCKDKKIREIRGYYYPTEKNGMVSEHYKLLGFDCVSDTQRGSVWSYNLTDSSIPLNAIIEVDHE